MPRQIELVGEKEKEDGHVFYFILFYFLSIGHVFYLVWHLFNLWILFLPHILHQFKMGENRRFQD